MKIPELKIETLAFRLAGSNAEISKINRKIDEQKQRKADELKIEREEKEIESRGFIYKKDENEKKNILPPEIQKLFDEMKKDILTN